MKHNLLTERWLWIKNNNKRNIRENYYDCNYIKICLNLNCVKTVHVFELELFKLVSNTWNLPHLKDKWKTAQAITLNPWRLSSRWSWTTTLTTAYQLVLPIYNVVGVVAFLYIPPSTHPHTYIVGHHSVGTSDTHRSDIRKRAQYLKCPMRPKQSVIS